MAPARATSWATGPTLQRPERNSQPPKPAPTPTNLGEVQVNAAGRACLDGQLLGEISQLGAARHQAAEFFTLEVILGPKTDHLTDAQNGKTVNDQLGVDFVMGNQNDGDVALLLNAPDSFQDFHLLLLAKGRGRFIEDENLGTEIDGSRDRECLFLATGHGAYHLGRIGDVDDDLSHLPGGDTVHFRHLHPPERPRSAGNLTSQEEIAGNQGERVEDEVLIDHTDARIRAVAGVRKCCSAVARLLFKGR